MKTQANNRLYYIFVQMILMVSSTSAIALSIHPHCEEISWMTQSSLAQSNVLITQSTVLIIFQPESFLPPAENILSEECIYEISDIQVFDINIIFSSDEAPPFILETLQNSIDEEFYSGVFNEAFPEEFLNAHQTNGAKEINAMKEVEFGPFNFTAPNNQSFIIESIDIFSSGSHYYVNILEPGVMFLVCMGILIMSVTKKYHIF